MRKKPASKSVRKVGMHVACDDMLEGTYPCNLTQQDPSTPTVGTERLITAQAAQPGPFRPLGTGYWVPGGLQLHRPHLCLHVHLASA